SCRCGPGVAELPAAGSFHHAVLCSRAIRGSPASMSMADSSRRIRIGDIELAYRITGRGKPVILVHGLACGQRMWFHQRRKLSDRHTVVTYHQRGHGDSDAPAAATSCSGGHLARGVAGMVDALSFVMVAIVGFSLGGGPALALAAARPERITHLVLADVGSGADDAWRIQWLRDGGSTLRSARAGMSCPQPCAEASLSNQMPIAVCVPAATWAA